METQNPENIQETAKDYFGYDLDKVTENVEKAVTPDDRVDPQELVNKTLKEIKVDDNGKFVYPEGIDPMLKIAVANAKSFRDTQASYTKTRQELKALEAEKEALKSELEKLYHPTADLSEDEKLELEELKLTNPEQWYKRMRALEEVSSKKIDDKLNEAKEKTLEQLAVEERQQALEEFNQNSEVKLTQEVLDMDVPRRYHQQLRDGEITWTEFLEKAAKFIGAPAVVKGAEEVPATTNMNNVSGGQTPIAGAEQEDSVLSMYKTGQVLL
jgi:hypothetical protein